MENLIRGSVCFGSDQEIASRSWRLGLRGPRLDAGATCLSPAAVCMAPGGPPSEQERTRFAGCLERLKSRVLIPEIFQSQPSPPLGFWFPLLPWACSLASLYGCRNRIPELVRSGHPERAR